jgi:PAS domain S-box-containing protein
MLELTCVISFAPDSSRPAPEPDRPKHAFMANSSAANPRDPSVLFGLSYQAFENLFDLFGFLDRAGNIIELRGKIFDKTTADPQMLVGQPFPDTVFWQSAENTSRIVDRAIKNASNGNPERLLVDFRMSADERVALDLRMQSVGLEGEPPLVFFCGYRAFADVSQKNPLSESDQLLLAAENADIGLWFWNEPDGRLYSTPRCNELFELSAYEELTYDRFIAAVHPDDRDFVEEFFEETRNRGTRYEEEFRVVYSDGSVEWLSAKGRSFLDEKGSPKKMVGVVRKITEEKEAAAELERVYELEKKARDDSEVANRAKDFFLAFVSHELRSPLNAILGWSKILLTREVNDETRRKALETIEKSAQVQSKLINDLVDSARVASGKLRLEYRQLNLVDVARSSFEAQKPMAESHQLNYTFESEEDQVVILGDSGRLQQIFNNLLSNAIKFTPPGGEVGVKVTGTSESVKVIVYDNGHGIEPKALPNIFKQFAQGTGEHSRRSGGLGLGLSIVNILVGKHGGKVWAESEGLGMGSRFIVALPLSESGAIQDIAPEARSESVSDKKTLNGVNVLVVEDDPDSREFLQLFLEQNGASVRAADSARAAMATLTESRGDLPDVIVSDLAMPEEDGYSLVSRIRELTPDKGGRIPALALSAFASAESRQRAFESGFQRYLTKPFEPDLIVDQILALKELGNAPEPVVA